MGKILSAYVLPHAPVLIPGLSRDLEREILATQKAFQAVSEEIGAMQPDTAIVITPHGLTLSDALCVTTVQRITGDFGQFGRKDLRLAFSNDTAIVSNIISLCGENRFPIVELDESLQRAYDFYPLLDHGAMVPLFFVQKALPEIKIVHISMGLLNHPLLIKFGEILKEAVSLSPSDCILIGSGDLSHALKSSGPYAYNPAGKIFDETIVHIFNTGTLRQLTTLDERLTSDAAQCGLRSFITLSASLNPDKIKSTVLSYEGPFGVGYCVAKIENL